MPCRRRAATASAENGTMSGKDRAAKRLKADGDKMGTAESVEAILLKSMHKF